MNYSYALRDSENLTYSSKEDVDRLFMEALHGDEFSFQKLFLKTSGPLFSMAFGIVRSNFLAEEIVHDVFLRIWRNRKELVLNSSANAYLKVSVRNMSFDYLRKYKKTLFHEDISDHTWSLHENQDPLQHYCYEELYEKVQVAISSLPKQCQTIFRLSREKGLKYKEIAVQMNLSVKTVETQMGRALKKLKKMVYED